MLKSLIAVLLLSVACLVSCQKELINITPDGYFTDLRDSTEYPYVTIGTQTWMMRNLAFYSEEGAWVYNDDDRFAADYGLLYSFDEAQKACPDGWRLPTDGDWKILEIYLGMDASAADSLEWRRSGTVALPLKNKSGWYSGGNGSNDSKFSALPGGNRTAKGQYFLLGDLAQFWTSSYVTETHAWGRGMLYREAGVYRWKFDKVEGLSVRCLKR